MKKVLFTILLLSLCTALSAGTFKSMALVSVSVTDMKSAPDYQAETVSQAIMGTPVLVTDRQGYWYAVETPEGYKGWTTELNVVIVSPERFARWKSSPRVIVTDYFITVSEGKDSGSRVISDCVMGNILEYAGTSGDMAEVVLPDGRRGYIPRESAVVLEEWLDAAESPDGEDIVSTAEKFLGFPYLWGGLSPKGLDCSGLVKLSYFMNGLILKRDAREQIETGTTLDYSDVLSGLAAGDLVFFGRKADGARPRSVTHVGIYMSDGMMIHSSLRVRINSLIPGRDDSYTSKSIVGAVRILGNQGHDPGIVRVADHPWYF